MARDRLMVSDSNALHLLDLMDKERRETYQLLKHDTKTVFERAKEILAVSSGFATVQELEHVADGPRTHAIPLNDRKILAIGLYRDICAYQHREASNHASADFVFRYIEALIARTFGCTDRSAWTDLLKADPNSQYAKDYSDTSYLITKW